MALLALLGPFSVAEGRTSGRPVEYTMVLQCPAGFQDVTLSADKTSWKDVPGLTVKLKVETRECKCRCDKGLCSHDGKRLLERVAVAPCA